MTRRSGRARPARKLTPAWEFMNALGTMVNYANNIDDELQTEPGGGTWEPAEQEVEQKQHLLET